MKSIINVIAFLLFLGLVISCEKDNSTIGFEPGPPGSFNYQSYDSLGNPVGVGWLTFEVTEIDSLIDHTSGAKFEGEWHIKNLTNRQDLGPQFGDGELVGGTSGSRIWMELNPQWADNNLGLDGVIEDNRIEGKWYASSFPGVTNWGTFRATKN